MEPAELPVRQRIGAAGCHLEAGWISVCLFVRHSSQVSTSSVVICLPVVRLRSIYGVRVLRGDVKVIRFHDARHTHASLWLKLGIHPKIVQERLGHSTIAITLDTYSHVAPGLQEAAAMRFDELLTPKYENGVVAEVG